MSLIRELRKLPVIRELIKLGEDMNETIKVSGLVIRQILLGTEVTEMDVICHKRLYPLIVQIGNVCVCDVKMNMFERLGEAHSTHILSVDAIDVTLNEDRQEVDDPHGALYDFRRGNVRSHLGKDEDNATVEAASIGMTLI